MMFKSRKQKQEEYEEELRYILDDMVADGYVYKVSDKYGLTDLGLCEAESIQRQGPIERIKWYIETTKMYMEKEKKK